MKSPLMFRLSATISVILCFSACDDANRSNQARDHAERIAAACISELVRHSAYDVELEGSSKEHVVTVIQLDASSSVDVVFVGSEHPYPDGPYWRCEVSQTATMVSAIEFKKYLGEPEFISLMEESPGDNALRDPVALGEANVLHQYEFRVSDIARTIFGP
jgi:hypothetical protein